MQPLDLLGLFTAPLDALGLRYFVTGSLASLVYGEPRLTHDADLVVELADADAPRLEAAFPAVDFYVPPVEVIRVERRRPSRGHFNIIHHRTGFKADIYPRDQGPLHAWAFDHRRHSRAGELPVWVAPPEYVVIRKLEYFREGGSEKHLRDIRAMIATLGDDGLDRTVLDPWIAELGLDATWKRALDSSGR